MFRPARKANRARKQGGMARGTGDLGGWAGSAENGAWGSDNGDYRGGNEGNELAESSKGGEGRGGEVMGGSGGSGERGATGEWRAESHRVSYGHIVDERGATIDEVLVLPMLAPRSYTSEDVVEVHCHGGRVCAHSCLATAVHLGARLAGAGDDVACGDVAACQCAVCHLTWRRLWQPSFIRFPSTPLPLPSNPPDSCAPGEFTLRAFLNGRVDLAQAEAVAALIPTPFHAPHSHPSSPHARQASEFTLRAFLNGRVDLAQAEAVAALIRADTAAAARSALAAVEVRQWGRGEGGERGEEGLACVRVCARVWVDLAQAEAVAALIRADSTAAARSALAAVEVSPKEERGWGGRREEVCGEAGMVQVGGLSRHIRGVRAACMGVLVDIEAQMSPTIHHPTMQGGLSRHIRGVRAACMGVLVDIEARIDFEEDLPPLDAKDVSRRIDAIWQQINEALATANRGRLLEYGIQVGLVAFSIFHSLGPSILYGIPRQVAIVGRPNVGKSSLLNAWTQSERAIVTDTPGTTRDVVEAQLHLPLSAGGFPVRLADTAGIRHTTDAVEAIGVQRSEAAAAAADVVLVVVSAAEGWTADDSAIFHRISSSMAVQAETHAHAEGHAHAHADTHVHADTQGAVEGRQPVEAGHGTSQPLGGTASPAEATAATAAEMAIGPAAGAQEAEHARAEGHAVVILVENKSDHAHPLGVHIPEQVQRAVWRRVATSATLRTGLDELEAAVAAAVGGGLVQEEGQQWAVNQRQQQQMVRAAEAVGRVRESIGAGLPLDFWSIDLRSCILALGQVSGEEDVTEEVLSNIFSKFCIGK
ncbi:unnamed protein product [Closterium sp. Naga37s-1]|nr:unnamed protein product [Closterium sp. Naga37s-1]